MVTLNRSAIAIVLAPSRRLIATPASELCAIASEKNAILLSTMNTPISEQLIPINMPAISALVIKG
jgi:hypothetical protein